MIETEGNMMLKRYADCPVCGQKTVLSVPPDVLESATRFPFTIKVVHEDHYFYINIDSKAHITDILSPELVE
ncbi:MAG: hypothetical protein ACXADO_12485 [Candidatus Thorarchaeota archaeon]|jgi:hypothetical protein